MEDATGKDETVPDRMVIGESLPCVKDDSEGVGETAQDQIDQTDRWDGRNQGLDDGNNQPSHRDVEEDRQCVMITGQQKELENGPDECQPPDHHKKRPPQRSRF